MLRRRRTGSMICNTKSQYHIYKPINRHGRHQGRLARKTDLRLRLPYSTNTFNLCFVLCRSLSAISITASSSSSLIQSFSGSSSRMKGRYLSLICGSFSPCGMASVRYPFSGSDLVFLELVEGTSDFERSPLAWLLVAASA